MVKTCVNHCWLAEVLANTNKLAVSLKGIAEQANGTFDSLQNNIIDTVDDLRDGVETFMVYAKLLADVWQAIFSENKIIITEKESGIFYG